MFFNGKFIESSNPIILADNRCLKYGDGIFETIKFKNGRLILFDEPAAGLSPAERRELVQILQGLPRHIGFVLIEHDLDIALRVVDRVTIMHNGRLLKHGTPQEIENDAEVQAIYMGSGHHGH